MMLVAAVTTVFAKLHGVDDPCAKDARQHQPHKVHTKGTERFMAVVHQLGADCDHYTDQQVEDPAP